MRNQPHGKRLPALDSVWGSVWGFASLMLCASVVHATPANDESQRAVSEVSEIVEVEPQSQTGNTLESVTLASLVFGGFALLATRQRRRVLKLNKVPR